MFYRNSSVTSNYETITLTRGNMLEQTSRSSLSFNLFLLICAICKTVYFYQLLPTSLIHIDTTEILNVMNLTIILVLLTWLVALKLVFTQKAFLGVYSWKWCSKLQRASIFGVDPKIIIGFYIWCERPQWLNLALLATCPPGEKA